MTTICMVIHAEGPGDLGSPTREVPPTESLLPEEQGPVHIIVQRVLTENAQIPPGAIDFREPLRTQTGVRAYGSRLLDPRVLDEILLGWLLRTPPLVVLLVDGDDSEPNERTKLLEHALERNGIEGAVGVAIREFETWLIADGAAVSKVLAYSQDISSKPEKLSPGKAKQMLNEWCSQMTSPSRDSYDMRKELAQIMDLDTVSSQCPSFKEFRQNLLNMNFSK